jgi:Domain of unknown function (DUF4249)
MKSLLILLTTATLLCSCEKVIELELNDAESKLVIEGNITNQPGPYYVKLTKSVRFDAASQYPPVSNAVVVITDNTGITDTLTYTSNGLYRTNTIQGVEGRIYNLIVVADAKTYAAKSTMPARVPLDSLRNNLFTFGGTAQNTVIPVYTDPAGLGNNYRFVMYVDNVLDKTYIVVNDNTENGAVNQRPVISNDIELETGNVVRIEMQCIDATVYTYYFTLSQAEGGGLGGGTTPSNPPNGITGGALGLFSAHTTQAKSAIIP